MAFLNRLFTPLSDIILEERGTIDKFMGDAVMAFWNAPLLDPGHAANACRAALRMQAQLARLNDLWAAEAAARGEAPRRVELGIGLNTGECCVGNVGSPQRFDYSILGDVVNIASRLESETKGYGVPSSSESARRWPPRRCSPSSSSAPSRCAASSAPSAYSRCSAMRTLPAPMLMRP
ncbi:MAG: adenylate/guanylate cyclase domain-containing protein [Hyphomicrobium sp.]